MLECVLQSLEHSQVAASVLSGESNRRRKEGQSMHVTRALGRAKDRDITSRSFATGSVRSRSSISNVSRSEFWIPRSSSRDAELTDGRDLIPPMMGKRNRRTGVCRSATRGPRLGYRTRSDAVRRDASQWPSQGSLASHSGLPFTFRRPMLSESIRPRNSEKTETREFAELKHRAMQASL